MTFVQLSVIGFAAVIGLACTIAGLLWEHRRRTGHRRRR